MMNKVAFVLIHLGALAAFWVGVSFVALAVCVTLYFVRMFGITGGYHRYFSHRTYNTSRTFQFILALLGASAVQKGPLWWAACHRYHHKTADKDADIHSPIIGGLWWAHAGWVLSADSETKNIPPVKDFSQFPEIQLLERYHFVPGVLLLLATWSLGTFLQRFAPQLHTTGPQMLVWGALVSTVLVYHCTFVINSLAHVLGRRRFNTNDNSRNSFVLALITLGEGWHNNHHRYPGSERQGFYWWEIDITHYLLRALAFLGIVWNLRAPPPRILSEAVGTESQKLPSSSLL